MDQYCSFIPENARDMMCHYFHKHHSQFGFRNPGRLVAKLFRLIRCRNVFPEPESVGADAVHAETSSARVPRPEASSMPSTGVSVVPNASSARIVDAAAASEPPPKHCPILSKGVAAVSNDSPAKGVRTTTGNEDIEDVQVNNASLAKSCEKEGSSTEITEPDGDFSDAPCGEYCCGSEPTEILPCTNSTDSAAGNAKEKQNVSSQSPSVAASGSINRKRNSKLLESSSPDSAASMRRKMSLSVSIRLSRSHPISGPRATSENPLVVEEAAAQTSRRGMKGKSIANTSSPSIEDVCADVSPGAAANTRIGKRTRATSESPSAANVSPKSRCGKPNKLGRSPLSHVADGTDGVNNGQCGSSHIAVHSEAAAAPSLDKVEKALGEGCSIRNPSGSLNPSGDLGASKLKNAERASSRVASHKKDSQLDEHAAPTEPQIGKAAPVEKHCLKHPIVYFNIPSMPSFRIFEDEDDFGNFIEDPKLRRPFPTVPATSCPIDRARSILGSIAAKSCPVVGASSAVSSGMSADVHQQVNPKDNWVLVNNLWVNPAINNDEETVQTENAETERHGNVETDLVHMVSVPLTELSETAEASTAAHVPAPVPIAVVSSTGVALDISPIVAPTVRYQEGSLAGGSSLSPRNIGSNGLSNDSNSLSSQSAWQSSSAKLVVHRPRRPFIPSKYQLNPYMRPQLKLKVSRHEADMYGVVLKMAESSEYSDLSVIDYRGVVVKLSALASSLRPEGNVNYFVVNALCRSMFHKNHPKNSYKHYFFAKVGDYLIGNHGPNDSKKNEVFEKAMRSFFGAKTTRPLASSHYLYFPILFEGRWFVVVVYIPNKWICLLDSYVAKFGVDSSLHKAIFKKFIPNLKEVWKKVVKIDFGFHGYRVWFLHVPQQHEDSSDDDSGIFAMKNLELYEANANLMEKYTQEDIPHLRIKFVNEMIWNPHNYSQDGKAKVQEYDAEVYEKYYKRT